MNGELARSLTVNIFGVEYPLKNVTDPDTVTDIAKYVDRRMREVAGGISLKSAPKVAVMAAMRISSELFALRVETAHLREHMDAQTDALRRALTTIDDKTDISER